MEGDEKMSLYDDVINIAKQIPLDRYGKQYLDAMKYISPNDEEAIRTQAAYIASNAHPKTDKEKKLFMQLIELSSKRELDKEKRQEILMERISESFERFTEGKVKRMPDEEEIWALEDTDVLKCSGKDNELVLKDNACYIMDDTTYEAFKKLPKPVQQKVRDLAQQSIVFDSLGVYAKAPDTKFSQGYGYRFDEKVEEYCNNKYSAIPDVVACEIEATVEGKIGDKYYDEWRISSLQKYIDKNEWMFNKVNVLSERERDEEIERLATERERNKISFNDFKRFAEKYNYPLDLVLKSNPWVDDVLADDAKIAIKKVMKK